MKLENNNTKRTIFCAVDDSSLISCFYRFMHCIYSESKYFTKSAELQIGYSRKNENFTTQVIDIEKGDTVFYTQMVNKINLVARWAKNT